MKLLNSDHAAKRPAGTPGFHPYYESDVRRHRRLFRDSVAVIGITCVLVVVPPVLTFTLLW